MRFPLRLAISILLIAILLAYVVDVGQVAAIMRHFSPAWLLLALVVVTLDRILMTYKWTVLLAAQGVRLPLWQAVSIYCASMVWGLALPATVGADAIRAVMVTRRGASGAKVVTSILVERLIGFVLALALAIVCLLILRSIGVLDAAFDKAVIFGVVALLAAIAGLMLSMNERAATFVLARIPQRLRATRIVRVLTDVASAYRALGASHGAIARFCALTVAEQLFAVTQVWAIAKGLGVDVNLLVLLGALPLSTLISRLPVSFDGLGVFEAVFVGLLALAGVTPAAALALAVSGRLIQLAAFLPWWAVYTLEVGRPPVAASMDSVRRAGVSRS